MKKTIIGVFFLLSLKTFATRFYVNQAATGTNNGFSWINAFTDLQSALSIASSGDDIWVSQGIYKPTNTINKNISFNVPAGVSIYGGFLGNEITLSQRDWIMNPTFLSGDIGALGNQTDNTFTLLSVQNALSQVKISGFIITKANFHNIFASNSKLLLENSSILSSDGDGLNQNNGGDVIINNCNFKSNNGFAIKSTGTSSQITVNKTSFKFNNGACTVYSSGMKASIDQCSFSGNSTSGSSSSGGVYTFNHNSIIDLERSSQTQDFKISNSLFAGNTCNRALYAYDVDGVKTVNCTFVNNMNTGYIISFDNHYIGTSMHIINSIIASNNNNNSYNYYPSNTNLNYTKTKTFDSNLPNSSSNINPNFINPTSYTLAPFDADNFDFRLKPISALIDIGDDNLIIGSQDLDQYARIHDQRVDLGAFESQHCISSTTIFGDSTLCSSPSVQLHVQNSASCLWNNTLITSSITVSSIGNYSVIVVDAMNCRATDLIIIKPIPISPTITLVSNNLASTSSSNYQWYLNSTIISGATSQTYAPSISGIYYVSTVLNGCTRISNSYSLNIVSTQIEKLTNLETIALYPNPSTDGYFNLAFPKSMSHAKLEVLDITGKVVYSETSEVFANQTKTINTEQFSKGIYILKISNEQGVYTQKISIN